MFTTALVPFSVNKACVTFLTLASPNARTAASTTAASTVRRSRWIEVTSHAAALRTRPELPWKLWPMYPSSSTSRWLMASAAPPARAAGSHEALRWRKSWLREAKDWAQCEQTCGTSAPGAIPASGREGGRERRGRGEGERGRERSEAESGGNSSAKEGPRPDSGPLSMLTLFKIVTLDTKINWKGGAG
eukprot:scaffold184544_cov29-Tisochrysis_lutea.AAC.1